MEYSNNVKYWSDRYVAPNCESFIFRFYGRILKFDFGIDGSEGQKVFDFGCGEGAALKFFEEQGFDVYGADIAEKDLEIAKQKIGKGLLASHFELIDPIPSRNQKYLRNIHGDSEWIDIFISIQTLDFLSDTDCEIVLNNIYEQMKPGAVIYASFNGYQMYYRNHGEYIGDGLWHINFQNDRVKYDLNYNFIESKERLSEKFHMFKCKYIDYYDSSFRNEGSEFRWTFTGTK
jgi:SAM-dependent methyltransferase